MSPTPRLKFATDEERKARARELDHARYLERKASETAEQREIRLEKASAANKSNWARLKAAETPEQREVRLAALGRYYEAGPEQREKSRARAKAYYVANKEKCKANMTAYWRAHKERAAVTEKKWREKNRDTRRASDFNRRYLEAQLKTANPNTIKELRKVRICYYCGVGLTLRPRHVCTLTIDHRQPLTKGGTNADENLVACCLSCNSSKNNTTETEFLAKLTAAARTPIKTYRKNVKRKVA